MKKALFALLAVLLVLPAVGCDNSLFSPNLEPEPAPGQNAADEKDNDREMVGIAINTGGASRALIHDLAQAGVNYYEVAFKDPLYDHPTTPIKVIYRSSWNFSETGRIFVPKGDYDGVDKAVLFAGRQSDRLLLAIGELTAVNGDPGTDITAATKSVTFTLEALRYDIDPPGIGVRFDIPSTVGSVEFDDKTYPLFRIATGTDLTAKFTITNSYFAGLAEVPGGSTVQSTKYCIYKLGTDEVVDGVKLEIGTITPNIVGDDFVVTVKVTPGTDAGLSGLSLEAKVVPLSNDYGPGLWYIKCGMFNHLLDQGGKSLGGTVLLAIGSIAIPATGSYTIAPSGGG